MIQRDHVRQTLLQFLREDTSADVNDLTDDTLLRDGLGLDSVDFVGLIMRIEGHYRIRLTHTELETVNTAGDLLNLVQSKTLQEAPLAA